MESTIAIYMKPRNCGRCYDWQTGGGPPSHICKECDNSHTIRCHIHKLGNILSKVTFEGEFNTRMVLTRRLRKIENDTVFVTGMTTYSETTQSDYTVSASTPIKVRVHRRRKGCTKYDR